MANPYSRKFSTAWHTSTKKYRSIPGSVPSFNVLSNMSHLIVSGRYFETGLYRDAGECRYSNMGQYKVFFPIYQQYIKKNKNDILKYIEDLKNKYEPETVKVSVYNMKCNINYKYLEDELIKILNNI